MNLELSNPNLSDELWSWDKRIGVFVSARRHYWVISHPSDFVLDSDALTAAYRKQGVFSEEVLVKTKKEFRGGISQLTGENLGAFLSLPSTIETNAADLREYLFYGLAPQTFCIARNS